MVLDQSEIPLRTNASENHIRCQVTRRKVSAGTASDAGRDGCDAFLELTETCDESGIPGWDYFGNSLKVAGYLDRKTLPLRHTTTPEQPRCPHLSPCYSDYS